MLSFRSYLWGIETKMLYNSRNRYKVCSDLTYEGLKQIWLLRNISQKKVQILPMRDWNNKDNTFHATINASSDLTYEGLKQGVLKMKKNQAFKFRSYLWGIETNMIAAEYFAKKSSDLTYEGLKHTRYTSRHMSGCGFRSYLWGIETRVINLDQIDIISVQILPMRDWNQNAV